MLKECRCSVIIGIIAVVLAGVAVSAPRQTPAPWGGTAAELNRTDAKTYLQIGFELMNNETIGLLRIGLTDTDVVQALGADAEKEPPQIWGADGREHQRWYYRSQGIQLGMVRNTNLQTLDRFTINQPCDFKTKRGIGIGSLEKDVRQAYLAELNPQDSNDDRLVAGSIFGGIIFSLQNGIVSAIFMGRRQNKAGDYSVR